MSLVGYDVGICHTAFTSVVLPTSNTAHRSIQVWSCPDNRA